MRHAFDAALDAFDAPDSGFDPRPAPPPAFEGFVAALPHEFAPGSHSLWELAAAWTPEADPPPAPAPSPPPPRPSARPEDIAVELDFLALRSLGDIARARRRFMWENHPDRRRDLDRLLANHRVAIANGLLDALQASLAKARRR